MDNGSVADDANLLDPEDDVDAYYHLPDFLGTRSLPPPTLPELVPKQHHPIASTDVNTQRLIVVLCNASLETFKSSSGSNHRGPGKPQDAKYSLLNSDDHIGIMRKMDRDISEARPDICHQVCSIGSYVQLVLRYTDPMNSACLHSSIRLSTRLESCKSTSRLQKGY